MSNSDGFSATPFGHNKPPRESLVQAASALTKAEQLLSKIPIAKTQAQADEVAQGARDVQAAAHALDQDRDARVRPLNARVAAINDEYRSSQSAFTIVLGKLNTVVRMWLFALDEAKKKEAERLRKEAEEKAEIARKAQEEAEREAERARDGDVTEGPLRPVEAARAAQDATLQARKAEARATAVEKAPVTAGGAPGKRAVGLRTKETPSIVGKGDAIKVVTNIGMTDPQLIEDLIKASRRFYKKHTYWPIGITITKEKI